MTVEWHRNMNFATLPALMHDGSLGGCAEKIGKGRWTGGHEFDKKLVHIRRSQTGRPSKFPCHEKSAVARFDMEATQSVVGTKMGVLPRTADPTGEVPGRVVMR
jgi:hypothetical protein